MTERGLGEQVCSFGIQEQGYTLTHKEVPIANFRVEKAIPLCGTEEVSKVLALQLRITQAADREFELVVELRDSICKQIEQEIPTCRILKKSMRDTLDAYLLEMALRSMQAKKLYLCTTGLHRLYDGGWVYVCGDTVLGDYGENECVLSPDVSSVRLAKDSSLSEREALEVLLDQMEEHREVLWPVFGYTLLSSLRSVVMQLGLSVYPVLYVSGAQGVGKSVTVGRYCLLFDEKDGPHRKWAQLDAGSTASATRKQLTRFRDVVALVDDVARGSNPAMERERTQLTTTILRFAANDSPRSKRDMAQKEVLEYCQCGVAFTGEVLPKSASDIERLIMLKLERPIRGGVPADRMVAATVFGGWMSWLLPQVDKRVEELRRRIEALSSEEQARIETTKVLLMWVLELFYDYAQDRGSIGKEYHLRAMKEVSFVVNKLLDVQKQMVRKINKPAPKGNLSFYILKGYREGAFLVVDRKNINTDNQLECTVHKECLCIRHKTLLEYFKNETPYTDVSEKKLSRQLEEEGVLTFNNEEKGTTKKIGSKKYLKLPLKELREASVVF